MKRVTVRDVATAAGVSTSTVSNVLNDYPHLRPATRERVLAAVARLGYRPSQTGRSLRSGSSRLVTLAIPDLRAPYFAELAHHLGEEGRVRGFALLVTETGADPERELMAVTGDEQTDVAGVILFAFRNPSRQIAGRRSGLPVVVLGRDLAEPWTDHFVLDIDASAAALVEHMIRSGRRRLSYLGWLLDEPWAIARRQVQCLRSALGRHGLDLVPEGVLDLGRGDRSAGRVGAEILMHPAVRCDGLIAANGSLAEGAVSAFRAAGLRVPEDVAIACWGGVPALQDQDDGITAVHQDHRALSAALWDVLEQRLGDDESAPFVSQPIPWALDVRSTTGKGRSSTARSAHGVGRVQEQHPD